MKPIDHSHDADAYKLQPWAAKFALPLGFVMPDFVPLPRADEPQDRDLEKIGRAFDRRWKEATS